MSIPVPRFHHEFGLRMAKFLYESRLRMTEMKHVNTEVRCAVSRNKICNYKDETCNC